MENFFANDEFYSELEDYIEDIWDNHEQAILDLPEDWKDEVIVGSKEKIFVITMDRVVDFIMSHTDTWEDRFPEDSDRTMEKIEKAIRSSVDIEKMNDGLPFLYYPSKEKATLTKKDLVDYIN